MPPPRQPWNAPQWAQLMYVEIQHRFSSVDTRIDKGHADLLAHVLALQCHLDAVAAEIAQSIRRG